MIVNAPHPHQSAGFGPKGPVFPLTQSIVVLIMQARTEIPHMMNKIHLHHIFISSYLKNSNFLYFTTTLFSS